MRWLLSVAVAGLLWPAVVVAQGPPGGGGARDEPPTGRRPTPDSPPPGGGPGRVGGFPGMAPPARAALEEEIQQLKRRVETLEAREPRTGPGPVGGMPARGGPAMFGAASGRAGFGGFPGGGFAPGGFGGGAATFGRTVTSSASQPADEELAKLNEQIATKRRELRTLEEQYRAKMSERVRERARTRQESLDDKLDRLLREVDAIRQELRGPRGSRTGPSRGE